MILLIDTAQEKGTIALSQAGVVLFSEENTIAKEHAAWLHMAVRRLLDEAKMSIGELEAVVVIAGPGSYTGLRVGLAAAKGFCYALKIPLITQNTLRVMGESMGPLASEKNALVCPLIDARRDEVYTAVYDPDMSEILPPQALILNKNSFDLRLRENRIIFFGSGSSKWEAMNVSASAIFVPQRNSIQSFATLAHKDFDQKKWADPVYTEPVYLKEFFSY